MVGEPHLNAGFRPTVIPARGGSAPAAPKPGRKGVFLLSVVFIFLLCAIFLNELSRSPTKSGDIMLSIENGSSVRTIATELEEGGVIRSSLLFLFVARWTGADRTIGSGVFKFHMPMDVFAVVTQLRKQEHGIERLKITIPEGTTLSKMGEIFGEVLPDFDQKVFMEESEGKEGYLFPDTYFFFANATSGLVEATLEQNFNDKTAVLKGEAETSRKNWNDIIVMASLIEEEAVKDEDRKIISGILWARMAKGMKLQVDAPFVYLIGKGSSELTLDDLAYDSPYNTYKYKGLPPAPITNPGLLAIAAALRPTKTPYLYYLSDKDGVMHYAKTFEEHKLNKEKYLY